jgi:hypothetical protein
LTCGFSSTTVCGSISGTGATVTSPAPIRWELLRDARVPVERDVRFDDRVAVELAPLTGALSTGALATGALKADEFGFAAVAAAAALRGAMPQTLQ